mmetsp:Transcript_15227/g.31951  ORF Transcript_15227/g.31951 Transcript_15227/m.31951 type:complete len:237 (+) Transcript_15227:6-716(+)
MMMAAQGPLRAGQGPLKSVCERTPRLFLPEPPSSFILRSTPLLPMPASSSCRASAPANCSAPSWSCRRPLTVVFVALSAAALPHAAAATGQTRHLSALQTAYTVQKTGEVPAPTPQVPRAAAEEALLARLRHLEGLSKTQRRKLAAFNLELTGEAGDDVGAPALAATVAADGAESFPTAAIAARVEALERGLASRAATVQALRRGVEAAVVSAKTELQESAARCEAPCTCPPRSAA